MSWGSILTMSTRISLRTAAALAIALSASVPSVPPVQAGSQEPAPTRPRRVTPVPQDGNTLELRSDLVTVTVSVADRNGHPIGGLSPESFRVFEDGRPQSIEHFATVGDPYSLLLLVDTSGSTATEIGRMRSAAAEFISGLGADDQLGIITFSRGFSLLGDMTSDRSSLAAQVAAIEATRSRDPSRGPYDESTGTSFYDALYFACAESPLGQVAQDRRKAVIVFSDCVDSTSSLAFGDIADEVERSGASVYFLLFDTQAISDRLLTNPEDALERINHSRSQLVRFYDTFFPESGDRGRNPSSYTNLERLEINQGLYEIARDEAEKLATRTGGRIYPVRTIGDLGSAYRAIAAELRSRYSIGYYPTNRRHDGSWRKLEVQVPAHPGARVVTRTGYWSPKD